MISNKDSYKLFCKSCMISYKREKINNKIHISNKYSSWDKKNSIYTMKTLCGRRIDEVRILEEEIDEILPEELFCKTCRKEKYKKKIN